MALSLFLKVRVTELQDSMLTALAKRKRVTKAELVRQILAAYAEQQFRSDKN